MTASAEEAGEDKDTDMIDGSCEVTTSSGLPTDITMSDGATAAIVAGPAAGVSSNLVITPSGRTQEGGLVDNAEGDRGPGASNAQVAPPVAGMLQSMPSPAWLHAGAPQSQNLVSGSNSLASYPAEANLSEGRGAAILGSGHALGPQAGLLARPTVPVSTSMAEAEASFMVNDQIQSKQHRKLNKES